MGWHRERCRRKARYRHQDEARQVLERRTVDDPAAVAGVRPYHCPFCRGWHLGHVPSLETMEHIAAEIRGVER